MARRTWELGVRRNQASQRSCGGRFTRAAHTERCVRRDEQLERASHHYARQRRGFCSDFSCCVRAYERSCEQRGRSQSCNSNRCLRGPAYVCSVGPPTDHRTAGGIWELLRDGVRVRCFANKELLGNCDRQAELCGRCRERSRYDHELALQVDDLELNVNNSELVSQPVN